MCDALPIKSPCSKERFSSGATETLDGTSSRTGCDGSFERLQVPYKRNQCKSIIQKMNDQPPNSPDLPRVRGQRTGLDVEDIKQSLIDNLFYGMGRVPAVATRYDLYTALALTVRDRVLRHGVHTIMESHGEQQARRVAYLSAEYLPGPHVALNLINLGITNQIRQALSEFGYDLDALLEQEEEPGLGNGGLGRLASCFMDSLASPQIPAIGYGIRYEFGIFHQAIKDGWQIETTDKWLRFGNPWEICRPEIVYDVNFGGHTQAWVDDCGHQPSTLDSEQRRQR